MNTFDSSSLSWNFVALPKLPTLHDEAVALHWGVVAVKRLLAFLPASSAGQGGVGVGLVAREAACGNCPGEENSVHPSQLLPPTHHTSTSSK